LKYVALAFFFILNSYSWALSPEAREFMNITQQLESE